jgi:hypothetical protein
MEEKRHRIAYAFYSDDWKYGVDDKDKLEEVSIPIVPEEFSSEMKGKIFCPLCATPLSRSPSRESVTKNNITAHFKHGDKQKYLESIRCGWRTPSSQGYIYGNEEEARRAVENKDLTIVHDWAEFPPTTSNDIDDEGEYNRTAIEDMQGPETELAIGRHRGEKFKVPSRISSIMAVCREFPLNLRKGFYFPNSPYPMMLSDQLYSANSLSATLPQKETLFFGEIEAYGRLTYRNVIYLKSTNKVEVKIYTKPDYDERKGISGEAKSRFLLFSANLYNEGSEDIVACKVLKWGAYSLLPKKYEKYLQGLI